MIIKNLEIYFFFNYKMTIYKMTIYLMRHAESEFNVDRKNQSKDCDITENGKNNVKI